jgi:hypothetical protein
MIRTDLGKSRVRESRTLGSVGATLNGLATRPSPDRVRVKERESPCRCSNISLRPAICEYAGFLIFSQFVTTPSL